MNEIERILNSDLENAKERAFIKAVAKNAVVVGDGLNDHPINRMISGPTGHGKTAIITQWGRAHQDEINFYVMDAALLTVTDIGGKRVIFSTDEIARMSKPDTVLFFDNYHRLDKSVEPEINKLMDKRIVVDLNAPGGEKVLDNILFVVVAVTV